MIENYTLLSRSADAPKTLILAQEGFFARYLGILFPPSKKFGYVGYDSLEYNHRITRTGAGVIPRPVKELVPES